MTRRAIAERFTEPERTAIFAVLQERQQRLATPEREERRLRRAERVLAGLHDCLSDVLGNDGRVASAPIARAARESYRRARCALRRVSNPPAVERGHALRRAAKRHQYQMQFLELLWHKPLKAQRKELARLTELLGSHHDVTCLARLLPPRGDAMKATFDAWQQELLGEALALAQLAFSERSRAFERRLRGYFAAQHALPSAA